MAMKEGFGYGRRLRIGLSVVVAVMTATAVWLLLNYVTTRPRLRTTFDLSRGAQFTISDATLAMIEAVRERGQTLEIHTFFLSHRDPALAQVATIQERVVRATDDLLRRLDYYGGDHVIVERHDVYRELRSTRQAAMGLEMEELNTLALRLGPRKRKLGVLTELADIELPAPDRTQPGLVTQPTLRGYKGEEAIASALRSLLAEDELVAYWLTSSQTAPFTGPAGNALSRFSRDMVANGFENRPLDLSTEGRIPADCRLLVIAGPEGPILARDAAVIEAYLRNGGRVLMTCAIATDGASSQVSFRQLLQPFGMSLSDRWLFNGIEDPKTPGSFAFGDPGCARITVRGGLSGSHPVTARLKQQGMFVELEYARALSLADPLPAGVTGDELLSTNPKSWEVDVPGLGQAPDLSRPGPAQLGTRHVGAWVEIAPSEPSGRKGKLAVVSGMAFRNGQGLIDTNLIFGLYLVNWLVRDDKFVAVTTSSYRSATMNVAPAEISRIRVWLVYVMPLACLGAALFLLYWRRRA